MSVQPSFEAQLQLQYADGLALPAALPSGSLLHMPCVPPQAAVETCTLAMMVQPPEDPLEPTGKPPWSDWGWLGVTGFEEPQGGVRDCRFRSVPFCGVTSVGSVTAFRDSGWPWVHAYE